MKPVHVLMAVATPVLWGLGITLSKVGLAHIPPMFLMSMRYGLAALVLIWFVRPPFGFMRRIFAAAVVSGSITYGMFYTGLRDIDASTATLVVQLQVPFLAILGVVFLKEKLSLRGIVGMVLAFGGVILISGEQRLQDNLTPVLIVIGGGLVWAVGQLMIHNLGKLGGMQLLAWIAAFAAPQLFVASLIMEEGQFAALAGAGWKEWGVILYIGLVMTALAYSMWYHLLGRCQINRIAPFLLLNPLTGVFASIFLLDEEMTLIVSIGGFAILLGITIMTVEPAMWRRLIHRHGATT